MKNNKIKKHKNNKQSMHSNNIVGNPNIADVFIPTSNRYKSLKPCLDSLDQQSNKNFNILLVAITKNDKIKNLVNSYKSLNIHYFVQKDKGIINAANQALNKSTSPIFIRIDDDVILDKDWFKSVISTFKSDNKIGAVTGPTIMSEQGIKSRDLTKFLNNFKKSNNPILKFISYIYFDYLYEGKINHVSTFLSSGVFSLGSNYNSCLKIKNPLVVNNLEACNFAVKTSLLKKIKGFDTIFLKGLGDYHEADTAMKIQNLGYKIIFNPNVKCNHNVENGTVPKSRPNGYYRIQNFIIFYFRHFKIKSLNQLLKFLTNVFMQNIYYFYKFLTTFDFNNLTTIVGTIVAFVKVIVFKKHLYKNLVNKKI